MSRVRSTLLIVPALALALAGCQKTSPHPTVSNVATAPEATACIADRITVLRFTEQPLRDDCGPHDAACAAQCADGDALACFNRALGIQPDDQAAALTLFERGCPLGDSISCVNVAASLWASAPSAEALVCAERVLREACDVGDPMGCGMRGRVLYSRAEDDADVAAVRAYLEEACARVSGFACRVLAYYLEEGALGAFDPAMIPSLLARACEGGDPGGCGAPSTAGATFTSH